MKESPMRSEGTMKAPRIYKRSTLLTVGQVRDRLNCSRAHVYRLIDKGESEGGLLAFRIGTDNGLRVPEDSLERFLDANRVDPGA